MEWQSDYPDGVEVGSAGRGVRWQVIKRRAGWIVIVALIAAALHTAMRVPLVREAVGELGTTGQRVFRWAAGSLAATVGPDVLLQQRVAQTIRRAQAETVLLHEMEAEIPERAALLDEHVPTLLQTQEVARVELLRLAALANQNDLLDADGQRLTPAATERLIAEKVALYSALSLQLTDVQRDLQRYRALNEQLLALQTATARGLDESETYNALLETMLLMAEGEPDGGSDTGEGLRVVSDSLRTFVRQGEERVENRRVVQRQLGRMERAEGAVAELLRESERLVAELDAISQR